MASYQDIDVRLAVVEDKIDFIMKLANVQKREPSTLMPGEFITSQMTMLDLYREVKAAGASIEDAEDGK